MPSTAVWPSNLTPIYYFRAPFAATWLVWIRHRSGHPVRGIRRCCCTGTATRTTLYGDSPVTHYIAAATGSSSPSDCCSAATAAAPTPANDTTTANPRPFFFFYPPSLTPYIHFAVVFFTTSHPSRSLFPASFRLHRFFIASSSPSAVAVTFLHLSFQKYQLTGINSNFPVLGLSFASTHLISSVISPSNNSRRPSQSSSHSAWSALDLTCIFLPLS